MCIWEEVQLYLNGIELWESEKMANKNIFLCDFKTNQDEIFIHQQDQFLPPLLLMHHHLLHNHP